MSETAATSGPPVLGRRQGGVVTVVINRPEQRNALDEAAKVALREALHQVALDASVRAVVLTGAGPAFCVGQDLAEHARALEQDAGSVFDPVDEHYAPIVTALTTMPKPVVAAVNGACLGAGLGLALACDLRVFSTKAQLGTASTGIGLTCEAGLSATLVAAVGQSRASHLVLMGDPFSVRDALAWGISGWPTEPADVLGEAQRLALRLAEGPTRAYAESKALLHAAGSASLPQMLAAESAARHRLSRTADHGNAVQALLADHPPHFTGE